ncbi:unnamed protein product [Cuscuta campestris]|uniref:RNase H type-1 domain-containing protein n=1 Tax=Cuscuta campestris TaxID=132261 RepID=A0A484LQR4_9ASTE|nr:unnamed protein product [Cuscuta campestris]
MVQTRSNVPTTSHVGGEEIAPGSGNGTGGIASTLDAVQALFGLGVTTEQLQAAVAALSAMGGNAPGAGVGKAPLGHHTEHAATSQHKGKKTRRSRRRPGKGPLIEEVLVEDVPEGEDDESSECRISAFKRLRGEDTRVPAFDWLNRGPEGRLGDLRRQISEGRRRNAEESATSDARSARPERTEGRRDERTQRRQSPSRTEKTKVPERGMTELAREIAELKRRVETKSPYSQPILRTVTPFTPRVMSVPLPTNFRPWQIKAYSGTRDPHDHLSKFYASMEAAAAPDELKCRCFLATLEGSACDWFNRLPKGTIDDWDTLAEKFLTHFAANRKQRLPYSHLLNICIRKGEKVRDFIVRWEKEARDVHGADDQALVAMFQAALPRGEGEKVRDFIVRWEKEARDVHGADDQALVAMFQAALPRGEVRKELRKNPPPTYQETLARAKFLASEEAEGVIAVSVIVGDGAHKAKLKMEFKVVSINCAHNMILGRPSLEDLECVISPYYLCMKFPTPSGIGVARGDQKLARSCYVRITKKLPRDETMVVHAQEGMRKLEARPSAEPAEEVEEVPLDPQVPERKIKVGATLTTSQRMRLVEVLDAYRVIFAWGPGDMPGVDPKIICHRLAVNPESRPVKKKKRFLSSERREFVSKEVLGGRKDSAGRGFNRAAADALFPSSPGPGTFPAAYRCVAQESERALSHVQVGGVPWSLPECTAREEPSPELEADGWWTVFTDGSSAAKNSGGGVVVIAPEGFRAYYSIRFGFKASNNEAEYEALLCGLRLAAGMNATKLRIKCDSKLVVCHVLGEFEAKDERMKKYRDTALELLKSFTVYSVEQIPRAENAEADILSKLSSDTPKHIRRMANVEELSEPSIHAFPVAMICAQPRDWTDDIVAFLKDGTLPDELMKAKLVRTRAPGYTLEGEKLYKRAYNGTLLRCLRPAEAKQVMEEVHAGICSAHQGARRVEGMCQGLGMLRTWLSFINEFRMYTGPRKGTRNTMIEFNEMEFFAKVQHACPDALPGQRPNLRVWHYSSVEEPSADHVRMLFPDEGLTFVLGTPPQEKSRAQAMSGCSSRIKA